MRGIAVIFLLLCLSFLSVSSVHAQSETPNFQEYYYQAEVIEIFEEGKLEIAGVEHPYQKVRIRFISGERVGTDSIIDHGRDYSIREERKVKAGDKVVVSYFRSSAGKDVFQIADEYRLDKISYFLAFFVLLILVISRWKGIGSLVGLLISILIILFVVVPSILDGRDPVVVTILSSIAILVSTIYLAHGFSKQTTIAIISTAITLSFTAIFSYLFVVSGKLSGVGTEEAYSLQLGDRTGAIEFRGLLLSGMILGALGVLDDITTSQSAAIFELVHIKKDITFKELIRSGMRIGREHISSLVNTLVLAYAGASMPIFIFFVLNPANQPLWFIINSEFVAEEIVRTLAGSIGLILAVPITTVLASYVVTRK